MTKEIFLSVIIPCYNEEKRIVSTVLATDGWLSQQKFSYEILVVNDGSKDKTASVVRKLMENTPKLQLIDNFENKGKGAVVKQGMLLAKGNYRLFMDADNSTTIDHFEKMMPLIAEGYEVIIGSRDNKDASGARQAVKQPFYRRLIGNFGNLFIQIMAVPGIWDTQCGFKCFSRKAALDIFSRCQISGWAFDVEVLFLARKLGYKIGIIPVYWRNDPRSHVSWRAYFSVLKDVIKIRLNSKRYFS